MMTQSTKTTLTPLEQLRADKYRLQTESRYRQQRLTDEFEYLQDNAGSLLISGLTSLLFPGSKTKEPKEEKTPKAAVSGSDHAFELTDIMALASGVGPLVWSIAQPFILTWGIKKVKRLLSSILFKKKK